MRKTSLILAAWLVCSLGASERSWADYTTQTATAADSGSDTLSVFGAPVTQLVDPGVSYAGLASEVTGTTDGAGFLGTTATLLEGTNTLSQAAAISMAWRNRATVEKTNQPPLPPWAAYLASDVVDLRGTQGTTFVLQMDYQVSTPVDNLTNGSVCIGWFDPTNGVWENAAETDLRGVTNDKFYDGSYSSFRQQHAGDLGSLVGWWGIDVTSDLDGEAWAVLDYDGEFAVVPEPGTIGLLAAGGLGLAAYAWRRGLLARLGRIAAAQKSV
jgi:hypothetical protein